MLNARKQRLTIVILLFLLAFIYSHLHDGTSISIRHVPSTGPILHLPPLPAANATLGFGAIVAVSRPFSGRRPGLLLAANITELSITIPEQPEWTEDDISSMRADYGSSITNGSALAWLGHLNVLRWFLESNLETMLVLEDDVDWDIHLRTSQIPHTAAAMRRLLSSSDPDSATLQPDRDSNYWGPPNAWDILYLGHCGDIFAPSKWNFHIPRSAIHDTTLPPHWRLHPATNTFLSALEIPPKTRLLHKSIFPLCTFGYALTRQTAARLVSDIAPRERKGGTLAYDVRVLEACRDEGLRCWTVNPELFHHAGLGSEIERVNERKASTDRFGRLVTLGGLTPNIACGARSWPFRTPDARTLDWLRDGVARKGICPRDVRERDLP